MEIAVSVNDLVIKSAAMALRDCPIANAKWDIKNREKIPRFRLHNFRI